MTPPASPPSDPTWHPVTRPDVVFRRVSDDWVVFDPATQRLHVLNLTAALVWTLCTGEHDVAAIEAEVRAAFGDVPDRAGVDEALAGFRDAGLLVEPA